jgi:hypothetical protein
MTSAFFSLILKDVSALLRPRRVSVVDPGAQSSLQATPHFRVLLALSDLHGLFGSNPLESANSKTPFGHTAAKLQFYAAQVAATAADFMAGLSDEVEVRAHREGAQDNDISASAVIQRVGAETAAAARVPSARVVEIG